MFGLGSEKKICDDCDVKSRCAMRVLVGEMDDCLLFTSCSTKEKQFDLTPPPKTEQEQIDEEIDKLYPNNLEGDEFLKA